MDRAFYAKEDRELYTQIVEQGGGRTVLVYFKVPKDTLWQRICARREAGVNADCALEISRERLDFYFDGFEVPDGEGEIVIDSPN